MKLSVWSNYYQELSPEEAVKIYRQHGYRYCELSSDHALLMMKRGEPAEVGRQFREFAASHSMEFLQGHLWLEARICEPEDREFLKKEMDMFRAIGIKSAVLHTDSLDSAPVTSPCESWRRKLKKASLKRAVNPSNSIRSPCATVSPRATPACATAFPTGN